jgi:hypothetical protein
MFRAVACARHGRWYMSMCSCLHLVLSRGRRYGHVLLKYVSLFSGRVCVHSFKLSLLACVSGVSSYMSSCSCCVYAGMRVCAR